eukprot:jgi/Botrbrau1/1324/Bobra.0063s0038.1
MRSGPEFDGAPRYDCQVTLPPPCPAGPSRERITTVQVSPPQPVVLPHATDTSETANASHCAPSLQEPIFIDSSIIHIGFISVSEFVILFWFVCQGGIAFRNMSSIPVPLNLSGPQVCRCSRPPQHPAAGILARPARRAEGFKVRVLADERPTVQPPRAEQEEAVEDHGESRRKEDTIFPKFEAYQDASMVPKRDPGSFPTVSVSEMSPMGRLRHELMNGAATGSYDEEFEAVFDPLRDGPARYLGYSNELGEAFAAWLPAFGVPLSYAVAIGYVLVDTADKGLKAYAGAKKELENKTYKGLNPDVDTPRLEKLLALERTIDTVVWQLLASVACPGYTIHTVVELTHALLKPIEAQESVRSAIEALAVMFSMQSPEVLDLIDKSLPTAVGLSAIPFIVHPIDNGIHALMNVTLRPAMREYICKQGQGELAGLALCEACKVESKTGGSKH